LKSKYYTDNMGEAGHIVFTEIQLRDYEILVSYRTMVGNGIYSSAAIRKLASDYSLSGKSIEKIVYPINN